MKISTAPIKRRKKERRWSKRKKRKFVTWFCILAFITAGSLFFNGQTAYIKVFGQDIKGDVVGELLTINPVMDPLVAGLVADTLIKAGRFYNVDIWLLVAIVRHESSCRIWVKNEKKIGEKQAMGLMQWLVDPKELEKMGLTEPEAVHIQNNIWICTEKLRGYLDATGSVKAALFKYNGVMCNIESGQDYASKVLGSYYDMTHKRRPKGEDDKTNNREGGPEEKAAPAEGEGNPATRGDHSGRELEVARARILHGDGWRRWLLELAQMVETALYPHGRVWEPRGGQGRG